MNAKDAYYVLIVVVLSLTAILEFVESYKIVKPYKFYRPKLSLHRPRWHPTSSKFYGLKRPPLENRHPYHRPMYARYAPSYHEEPPAHHFTLVIQLAKQEKRDEGRYQRDKRYQDDEETRDYFVEEDTNDHENFESRSFRLPDGNMLRIKIGDDARTQVHVKVSKMNDESGIDFADASNDTTAVFKV